MKHLSGKEKKQLNEKLPRGYEVSKKDNITEKDGILYKDDDHYLIIDDDGSHIPHLKSIDVNNYSQVFVDKGAVPFVLKGADIMRPGIDKIDSGIWKGDLVAISHEGVDKPLAIGKALFDSGEMEKMDKGKVIEMKHYLKDDKY